MIRYSYPILHNWLKFLYWSDQHGSEGGGVFRNTTDFRHIKENYTKSHGKINPLGITPRGPWPDVEEGFSTDYGSIEPGGVREPGVLEWEKKLR